MALEQFPGPAFNPRRDCGRLIGIFRWRRERRDEQTRILEDREDEREKRSEQRFQSVVKDLSDEDLATRIGAAIMLRTFLRPGYEQFYAQVFDLTVAHLRLHRRIEPTMTITEPHRLLTQALITVFKESFPHARDRLHHSPHLLTGIQLGRADLAGADLKQAWIPEAYLAFCQELGERPEKAFSGHIPFRTNSEHHRKILIASCLMEKSINAWMDEALTEAAERIIEDFERSTAHKQTEELVSS